MANNITVHIEDHSREVLEALHNAIIRGAESIGETAVGYAQDNLDAQGAVDTGRLRNSVDYEVEED